MSNFLKFKELMDKYRETRGEFKPDIVLAYKDKDSGYGELFTGYQPLFNIDLRDLLEYLTTYDYLLDESKANRVKDLEERIKYYDDLLQQTSITLDEVEKEINNIKHS